MAKNYMAHILYTLILILALTLTGSTLSFAEILSSDLENLRTASSTLVTAYEKIDLFNAWEKIREEVQDFATRVFNINIINKLV